MPTESELRAMFRNPRMPASTIDSAPINAASIIRRSKRRRLPAQLGVGSALTLAVAGIGVASINGLRPFMAADTAGLATDSSAESFGENGASDLNGQGTVAAPAEKLNLCGGPLAEVAPRSNGVELVVQFPSTAAANGETVTGIVSMTNNGTATITGTTAASPAITVSQDGVTRWHSNGPMIMLAVIVDLAPGESMVYKTALTPVHCDTEDELSEGFREDLPALGPGEYQVSAAIDLSRDGAPAELITGDPSPLTLK